MKNMQLNYNAMKSPYFERIKGTLRAIRKRSGLTQQEVADLAGLKLRQYVNIEATGRTAMPTLEKIAKVLGVDIIEFFLDNSSNIQGLGKQFKIPVVNSIPASGFLKSYDDMVTEEYTVTTLSMPGLIALRVNGDSMYPEIQHGDLALVAPDQPFEDGGIYAVINGDSEATLKIVKKVSGGYMLKPRNPDFDPIFLEEDKILRLYKLIGVTRLNRKFGADTK